MGVGGGVQRLLGGGKKGSFCRSLASCSSSQPLTALDSDPETQGVCELGPAPASSFPGLSREPAGGEGIALVELT